MAQRLELSFPYHDEDRARWRIVHRFPASVEDHTGEFFTHSFGSGSAEAEVMRAKHGVTTARKNAEWPTIPRRRRGERFCRSLSCRGHRILDYWLPGSSPEPDGERTVTDISLS